MLVLDYHLNKMAIANIKERDLASVDLESLRYYLFPGDIVMKDEEVDFSTQWGWVPVLDFALCLNSIAETLGQGRLEVFEFTESDATLEFRLQGGSALVSSNYAPGLLCVAPMEFRESAQGLLRRTIKGLCDENPSLAKNSAIRMV